MKRDTLVYLRDIIDNIQRAEDFVAGLTYEGLINDSKTSYAVVRCLEIIGEAAKHVPDGMRRKYPEVPWQNITGMRDVIVHSYSSIEYSIVWKALKTNLPELRVHVQKIIDELKDAGSYVI
jgi:uncharacterized protein with HEPN domain